MPDEPLILTFTLKLQADYQRCADELLRCEAKDRPFWRRTAYRSLFEFLEAWMAVNRTHLIPNMVGARLDGIGAAERTIVDRLMEQTDPSAQKKIPFLDNLKANVKLCLLLSGLSKDEVNKLVGRADWGEAVIPASKVRDRIAHPKADADYEISDEETLCIGRVSDWFIEFIAMVKYGDLPVILEDDADGCRKPMRRTVKRKFLKHVDDQCELAMMAHHSMSHYVNYFMDFSESDTPRDRLAAKRRFWCSVIPFLSSVANISKVFFPSQGSQARATELRADLGITHNSIFNVQGRSIRNRFEHIDEYLDAWAENASLSSIDLSFTPQGFLESHYGIETALRNFDPRLGILTFAGEAFPVTPVYDAIAKLQLDVRALIDSLPDDPPVPGQRTIIIEGATVVEPPDWRSPG